MKRSDDGFALDPAKSRATTQAAQDQRGRSWLVYPPGTLVLVTTPGVGRPRAASVVRCGRCSACVTVTVRYDDGTERREAGDKVTKAG